MNPIHHTVLLTDGSAQTIDLRQVARVDGGTLVQGGSPPPTIITMADGTVYACTFLMLGPVITAMQAHGLV